jgi:hypothetical protein
MAKVNKQAITWCWELTHDVNGRPSRELMPYEIALKGLISDEQGIGRQQFNELFYQFGKAIVTIEEGYEEAVESEAGIRSQADADLQQNIDQEASVRQQAVQQEVVDRQSADNIIQQNVNQEVIDRQQAISDEVTARQNGDQAVVEYVNQEVDFLNQELSPLTGSLAQAIMQQLHPVGSIYTTAGSEDPATQLGFGTWVKRGGFPVGQEDGDADFDTVGNTGGSKTHTHSFTESFVTSSDGGENLTIPRDGWGTDGVVSDGTTSHTSGRMIVGNGSFETDETLESLNGAGVDQTITTSNHNHSGTVSGTTTSTSNLPPYRVYNIWERTA